MDKTNFIEAVTERDIDLLVLEELHVSPNFQGWVVRLTYGDEYELSRFDCAWHSLSHPTLGESDLILSFYSSADEKYAVLIENKIDAPPQSDQGARYKARGEAGIEAGDWQRYKTCILAPQLYLSKVTDANTYDVQISYEAVRDWFQEYSTDSERARYKSRLLREAIEQNRRGYNPKKDEQVTRFWHSYWICASREFPELSMKEPSDKPSKATWIDLRPKELGRARRILHKLDVGFVDLQIDGAGNSVDALKSTYGLLLGHDADIVLTGRSASVRVSVPVINDYGDFDSQIDKVRAGLRAAYRLLYLSRAIGGA